EHVVDAVVLVRALHRDHVAGLLHDADQPMIAARVLADPAARLVGEVEAHLAQTDPFLDLADRICERTGVFVGGAKDVEGEPLRGAVAHPGQLRELGDEALDGGREPAHRPGSPSPPRLPRSSPPVAPPSLRSASSCALRSASLTAASTMSARISASSGSTAWGSILTSRTCRSPLILTVTIPPPADASTTSLRSSS